MIYKTNEYNFSQQKSHIVAFLKIERFN